MTERAGQKVIKGDQVGVPESGGSIPGSYNRNVSGWL